MNEHETDGVNETFHSNARAWLTAGGLIAEQIVRQREQAHRDAQAVSEQQVYETYWRIDAQRNAAIASLRPMHEQGWWDSASAEDIGVMWETSNAWSREPNGHPVAIIDSDRMREQLRTRYAIDVDSLDADPGAVRDALDKRDRARELSERAREKQREDEAAADQLVAQAYQADRAQDDRRADAQRAAAGGDVDRAASDALYDSAERRAALADRLSEIADQATVEAVVTADTMHARPAAEAAAAAPSRAPVARRGRGGAQRGATRRSDRGR